MFKKPVLASVEWNIKLCAKGEAEKILWNIFCMVINIAINIIISWQLLFTSLILNSSQFVLLCSWAHELWLNIFSPFINRMEKKS